MTSDALKKAKQKYYANSVKHISLKLVVSTDHDIINKLDSVDNIRAYLMNLVRFDIARRSISEEDKNHA